MGQMCQDREDNANSIARELVYILYKSRECFPGAYDYFMSELDITDDILDEAFNFFSEFNFYEDIDPCNGRSCDECEIGGCDHGNECIY